MNYKKVTVGFVVQSFKEDGIITSQEFIAGDEVSYEDGYGDSVDIQEKEYVPFHMVQPEDKEEKQRAVIAALAQIKEDAESGDFSAIEELLDSVPLDVLKNFLPED